MTIRQRLEGCSQNPKNTWGFQELEETERVVP